MTEQVTLTIDGQEVTVPAGTLVVDAAAKLRIEIPVFCSHPKLDPVACCRMCLVEIDGPRGPMLQTACSVPVRDGMVVRTNTEQVKATQEANLAFILLNHPLDCPICDKGGECPLQDQTMRFGPGISQLVEPKRHKQKHYLISDTIVLDQERCVICWRCIRYLEEWEDKPQLGLFERGGATIIDIQDGKPVDAKTSGNIIDICPVGALTNRVARFAFRPWEIERTPSVCNHCSIGCNIRLDSRTHTVRRIVGRENMQVNDQWICDKGRFAHAWVNSQERLTMPLVRKNGELVPTSWKEAIQTVADRLREIKERHGPNAIGGIGSAKLSNESNYLFQRFMRELIGTNNIDHRDGAEVAALPTGLPALADVMKPQYGPDPKVDTIFLFGVDPSEELPILDLHLKRAVRRGGARLIIAHPRKIELTRYNGPYLGYRPGTEATLLNGLTKAALAVNEGEKPRVEQMVADVTEQQLQELCGVDPATVQEAARLLAESKQALIIYGPMVARGANGQNVVNGLINLAMATGHYERLAYVGLEANSQGVRDMGVLPNQLPGYASLDDPEARQRLERLWGCQLPTDPGLTYRQMLDGAGQAIKALYIMGANPASERPTWAANLDKLDFLVVQELFLTETAQKADVVLPAVSWAECDGTFTNLERRVQRAPKAVQNPHSKAAPDWMILDHLAVRMGVNWPYADEQAITREISQAIPFYGGLTWDALGDQGLQWDAAAVRPRPAYRKVQQPPLPAADGDEFTLVTGTVLYDGGTLFRLTTQMQNMAFGPVAGFNPADAERLGIQDGAEVQVGNDHGQLTLKAVRHAQVQPGTVWIPESLPGAPVGALLNGSDVETVRVKTR
ncbi:NADH-quinone oxidoreductase subunit NuoG [Litorilinea aerophila]|uniref:NADH-quinone oxidoreductase n=1 Tax=Litorilinea aerophila TaxID=1204385 RepID=A0A540VAR1_9CHLR|nr:NADH-quinone oxidoreductase subunit NuoG [Litorilinea aerophila]MCC9078320.1 NADH-quinone oxidoreductase subunit NuoG [Litorilinea aerophila]GIV77136.1 MAG: NADH-quinone oxidoreductase [Litorilinea sp.]